MRETTTQFSGLLTFEPADEIKLKEYELKHEQKLYTIGKHYYETLEEQKAKIKERLKSQISEQARQLLLARLNEIENEIVDYYIDNSKIQKLEAEIEKLKERLK